MRLRKLLHDDEAVSPVIGVILMVAITVILAAVIASFVLGLGSNTTVAPQASFTFDYDSDATADGNLTITHDGGKSVRADAVYLRGSGFEETGEKWLDIADGPYSESSAFATASGEKEGKSAIVSGDRVVVTGVSDGDYEISVNWEAPNGDTTSTLADDKGPQA